MNKKQLRKELNRIQKVHENTVKRIDNLEINIEETSNENKKLNNENKELNNENKELNNENKELKKTIEEQGLKIEEQGLKIEEQGLKIEEQSLKIEEQSLKIKEQSLEQEDIKKVQERQGLDIAELAKIINNLEDKKIFFENEYATWEDKYQRIELIIKENPDLRELINRGSAKQGMENARVSIHSIDEKIDELHKLVNKLRNFDKFSYNNVLRNG